MHKVGTFIVVALWMAFVWLIATIVEQFIKTWVIAVSGGCQTCGHKADYVTGIRKIFDPIK